MTDPGLPRRYIVAGLWLFSIGGFWGLFNLFAIWSNQKEAQPVTGRMITATGISLGAALLGLLLLVVAGILNLLSHRRRPLG